MKTNRLAEHNLKGQPTPTEGSMCTMYLFVAIAPWMILHWRSPVLLSMGSLYKDHQQGEERTIYLKQVHASDQHWMLSHRRYRGLSSPLPQKLQAEGFQKTKRQFSSSCHFPTAIFTFREGKTIRDSFLYWSVAIESFVKTLWSACKDFKWWTPSMLPEWTYRKQSNSHSPHSGAPLKTDVCPNSFLWPSWEAVLIHEASVWYNSLWAACNRKAMILDLMSINHLPLELEGITQQHSVAQTKKKFTSCLWISTISPTGGCNTVILCHRVEATKLLVTKILPLKDNCGSNHFHLDIAAHFLH